MASCFLIPSAEVPKCPDVGAISLSLGWEWPEVGQAPLSFGVCFDLNCSVDFASVP